MTYTNEINEYFSLDECEIMVSMKGKICISKSQKQEFEKKFESLINEYRV